MGTHETRVQLHAFSGVGVENQQLPRSTTQGAKVLMMLRRKVASSDCAESVAYCYYLGVLPTPLTCGMLDRPTFAASSCG